MAESICQGMLVAPSTNTPSMLLPTPCICTRNSVLIRRLASLSPSPRDPQSESTSSIKIIEGLDSRAIWKSCLTNLDQLLLRPPFTFAHPLTHEIRRWYWKKRSICLCRHCLCQKWFACPWRLSLISILTPNRRMPLQGVRFPTNKWGNLMGKITASLSASLAPSSPAISSHRTFGFSDNMAPCSASYC